MQESTRKEYTLKVAEKKVEKRQGVDEDINDAAKRTRRAPPQAPSVSSVLNAVVTGAAGIQTGRSCPAAADESKKASDDKEEDEKDDQADQDDGAK